jgi:hypothetical protein
LIKVARDSQQAAVSKSLLDTFIQKVIPSMDGETDPDSLYASADGIGTCLKNSGPGCISGDDLRGIVQKLMITIEQSQQRTIAAENEKKGGVAGVSAELQGDEDDVDQSAEDEEACRRGCEEALGACMEAATTEFVSLLPDVGNKLSEWLGNSKNVVLGLFLACDMLLHLKDKSAPLWPVMMPAVFKSLQDVNPDVRTPAAYAVNLGAQIPQFAEAAPDAFRKVAQLVSGPAPKKRDNKGRVALDNAVAALISLARHQGPHCPAEVNAWSMALQKLPLQADEDEAKKVHKIAVELLMEQHPGFLGASGENLGKILSTLAEVYKSEQISEKAIDEKILQVFRSINTDKLRELVPNFSDKQQKKIEKMLTA